MTNHGATARMDRQRQGDAGRNNASARRPAGSEGMTDGVPDNSLGAVIREVTPMFLVVAALIALIETVLGIFHVI